MAFYNQRYIKNYPLGLLSLDGRTILTGEHKSDLTHFKKGYEGEVFFDERIKENVKCDSLVMCDLLLKQNNIFQIDTLIITSNTLYLYEIKNFSGKYKNQDGLFLTLNDWETTNPMLQLEKTASLLRQLFRKWNLSIKVEANIVFTHPSFYLYNDNPDTPFIYYYQIDEHLEQLNHNKKSLSARHHKLAKLLEQSIQEEAPYQKQLPLYSYTDLKKGLRCTQCRSFTIVLTERQTRCRSCNHIETTKQTILKAIEEFRFLFPENKLTTAIIYDWCDKQIQPLRIRSILAGHYKKIGKNKGAYYT